MRWQAKFPSSGKRKWCGSWRCRSSFLRSHLPGGRNCQEGYRAIRQTDEPSQLFSDSVGNELEPFRPWGGGCCPPRAYGGVGDGVPHIMSQCDGMAPCSKSLHGGGCAHDLAYPCAPGSGWNPKPGRAVANSANK